MASFQNTLLEMDVLRSFVAISETGSFTAAARLVLRTPSAISMQIKKLEEQVGRQLFVREGRSVSLTADGEALLGYGKQMLMLNTEALTRFQGDAVEGTVSFGAPDDFGTRFLPNILARFAKTHPSVEVNVSLGTSANMLRQLASAALDLTIVTTCQGQLAALMADLAVAPLPLSLLGPGFERLDLKRDLPLLQNY
ncbi:MAG: LysR family transcriptional regulator, partial [Burkholderiaceae bacterium]